MHAHGKLGCDTMGMMQLKPGSECYSSIAYQCKATLYTQMLVLCI
jgi:hypothetical protein